MNAPNAHSCRSQRAEQPLCLLFVFVSLFFLSIWPCWPLFEVKLRVFALKNLNLNAFMTTTTILCIYVSSPYKVCPWTHLLWRCWVWGQCVCLFWLQAGETASEQLISVLSEGILGEQRAPTFAWNDKKVCRQQRERGRIRLREREWESPQYASSN